MSVLLIGMGNPLRGDDGAGIIAAQRLNAEWEHFGFPHKFLQVHQLMPEVAEEFGEPGLVAVIFVDASVREGDGLPSHHYRLDRISAQVEGSGSPGMTHYVSPAMLLMYAQLLHTHPPAAWVLGLPATGFEFGANLSETARFGVDAVQRAAQSIWQTLHQLPESI